MSTDSLITQLSRTEHDTTTMTTSYFINDMQDFIFSAEKLYITSNDLLCSLCRHSKSTVGGDVIFTVRRYA